MSISIWTIYISAMIPTNIYFVFQPWRLWFTGYIWMANALIYPIGLVVGFRVLSTYKTWRVCNEGKDGRHIHKLGGPHV